MNKKMFRPIAFTTVFILLIATFLGCQKKPNEGANEDKKLTYFAALTPQAAGATVKNLAETPLYKKMKEITGVDVEFIHPAVGQEKEQINLLIASKDLPDIVEYTWSAYPGGVQKAIDDGVIISLSPYMDNVAVNLKKVLTEDKKYKYDKLVKTDQGNYYMFPFLAGDDSLVTFQGPVIRKDWLDNAGLAIPETIDEWDTMLSAFQKRDSKIIPLSMEWDHVGRSKTFMGAYGVIKDFYLKDDGKVAYGPIEQGYKEYLKKMSEWYKKGYLDKDFSNQTTDSLEAKVMGDKVGATILMAGSQIGKVVKNAKATNREDFKIVGVPFPSLVKGQIAKFGHKNSIFGGFGAAISATCQNPKVAIKWLDYAYSEEGHMLYNFGILGESYDLVDGYPKYRDNILSNKEGLSFPASLGRYARSMGNGPFVQDHRYMEQYVSLPEQREAVKTWIKADNKGLLPVLNPNDEDSKKFAGIMNDVSTLISEFELSVILGQRDIEDFDKIVKKTRDMGIDEAIKIKEKALENFNKR